MALTIPSIKDESFLEIMKAMTKRNDNDNSITGPMQLMDAVQTGFNTMPYTRPSTIFDDMIHTPQMEKLSSFGEDTQSSLLAQQDWSDKQAELKSQSEILGMMGNNAIPSTPSVTQFPTTSIDAMSEMDKQEVLEAENIAKRFGVPSTPYIDDATSSFNDVNTKINNIDYINRTLAPYKGLNFVDRILNPDPKKVLKLNDENFATHMMSYATTEDGYAMMYPEVVEYNGKLVQLSPKQAAEYAVRSGEYIKLPEKEAEWLSKNYKKLWGDTSTTPKENAYSEQVPYSDGILPQESNKVPNSIGALLQGVPSQITVTTPPSPITQQKPVVTQQQPVSPFAKAPIAISPENEKRFNELNARIELLKDSSPDLLTQQNLLHLNDMVAMDPDAADRLVTGLESQAKAMGNNRGPFGGGYNQYLETLSRVEQGEREVVEKYKKLFEERGVILKDKPTPNWFMLAAGLMIGGKGGAAFLNGYTQSYQARFQNERNSKIQMVEDQMKALEMDAKMLGSEEGFSKARLSVAADTTKILSQIKDTITSRYTVEKAPEMQNLFNWEVQRTLDNNGQYVQPTFQEIQKYMLVTKLAKTPKEAEVAARIYFTYKQDSIQKLSSQMLHNIWSTNLQTAAIEQRKTGKSVVQDTLTAYDSITFSILPSGKESQIPATILTRFKSAGTLPVLSNVAQLIATGVIPLSVTSTACELTAGLPSSVREDALYQKYYAGKPNELLKDVSTMLNAFSTSINLPKLQGEVVENTSKLTSAYNNVINYALKDISTASTETKNVIKTMVGHTVFSNPELINDPALIKTFAQYLGKMKEEDLRKIATPTNIFDDLDYAAAISQTPHTFLELSKKLKDGYDSIKSSNMATGWAKVHMQNAENLGISKKDTELLKKSLSTIQGFKSGLNTALTTTPITSMNTAALGETVDAENYSHFYTAAAKSALYGALARSLPKDNPELRIFVGDSDAQTSAVASSTKVDPRDEFNLYTIYTKDKTNFSGTIDGYLHNMRISAIQLDTNNGVNAFSTTPVTDIDSNAWFASKLRSPKVVAAKTQIEDLTTSLSSSNTSVDDPAIRKTLRSLDAALKLYRKLLSQ